VITQGIPVSFKAETLQGIHDFSVNGDQFYLALFTEQADLSSATTMYEPLGEVVGTGYTAGGLLLTNLGVGIGGQEAYTSWEPAIWQGPCIFNVRGGLVYNKTKGNKAVDVLDFGMTYNVNTKFNNGPFTVNFPPFTSSTAPIIFGGSIYLLGAPA
jgi:hypothetical protein